MYTEKGLRLTDLYREGGRAILGWGAEGSGAFTVFKDVLQRGLTGSFATAMTYRLEKAVGELLHGKRRLFVLEGKKSALEGARLFSSDISFYKPWALTEESSLVDFSSVDCVIVEPPFAWAGELELLSVKESLVEKKQSLQSELPTVCLAPAMEAALSRALYDLIAALGRYGEKDFFIYDKYISRYWLRKGPYLFAKVDRERYADFVAFCLDCQVVPPPVWNQSGIVPFGADKGVFAKLKSSDFV